MALGTIIPNLLTVSRSMRVIDPKGENTVIADEARKLLGACMSLCPSALQACAGQWQAVWPPERGKMSK